MDFSLIFVSFSALSSFFLVREAFEIQMLYVKKKHCLHLSFHVLCMYPPPSPPSSFFSSCFFPPPTNENHLSCRREGYSGVGGGRPTNQQTDVGDQGQMIERGHLRRTGLSPSSLLFAKVIRRRRAHISPPYLPFPLGNFTSPLPLLSLPAPVSPLPIDIGDALPSSDF